MEKTKAEGGDSMFAFEVPLFDVAVELALWLFGVVCSIFVGFAVYALCYSARAITGKDDIPVDDGGVRGDEDGPIVPD